jgi:hypothetical protein
MKNKRKNNISEATAEAMGLGGYAQSAGHSDYDQSGRGSVIPSPSNTTAVPIVAASMSAQGMPVVTRTAPGTHATKAYQDISEPHDGEETATRSNTQEGEDSEEEMLEHEEEMHEEAKIEFRNALISLLGENVDASLVNKLEAIFEAAVSDRVEKVVSQIVENVDGNVKTYLDDITESLVGKVDDYLDYVVEEWMTDNSVAIEQGIKTQIAENFISGLKNLFENHYIDVPAEKYNVLDELYASNRELEEKLNEAYNYNINLRKEVSLTECAGIFVAETKDLADTQVAKLQGLMENVSFESPEEYREKLVAIRENYLNTRPAPARTIEPEQTFAPVRTASTNLVENYVGALGRLNKKL